MKMSVQIPSLIFLSAFTIHVGAAQSDPSALAKQALRARGVPVSVERLIQYAGQGDWTTVSQLLAAGIPVTAADDARKITALHNAAAQGHTRIVRELISRGADVNAVDWMGATPLANAAYFGRVQVIPVLIEAGAELGSVTPQAADALSAAVLGGAADSIAVLLAAGADPDLESQQGISARELAEQLDRSDLLQSMQSKIEAGAAK